jgi:hypothetical protein
MLIAKVILRSTSRFHIDSEPNIGENQQQQVQTGDDKKTVKSQCQGMPRMPSDMIPKQVKATLDNLLGGPGAVDRLPLYQVDPAKLEDTMTDPIMRGTAFNPETNRSNPFIAIKMRCLSSLKEVKEKRPYDSKYISEPVESVVALRPLFIEKPLMWVQDEPYSGIFPQFFKGIGILGEGNFTYSKDGQLTDGHTQAFGLLQRLIKEGSGEDSNGLRWEIIGHQTQQI